MKGTKPPTQRVPLLSTKTPAGNQRPVWEVNGVLVVKLGCPSTRNAVGLEFAVETLENATTRLFGVVFLVMKKKVG